MPDRKRQLARISEELLSRLAQLRRTEQEKRNHPISSPEFHRLAESVTAQSRDIMRISGNEEAIGNEADRSTESIDDVVEGVEPQGTTSSGLERESH